MAKKVYTGVDNHARNVQKLYVGVNDVARKVVAAYVGDANGIARQVFSAKVKWNKYASSKVTLKTYVETSNTSTTKTIYFGPESQIESKYTLYKSYTWSATAGYSGSSSKAFYVEDAGDAMGYYDISTSGSYEYLWKVTSATDGNDEVKVTRIGTTKYSTSDSYSKGALIGTVEAPEGDNPENFTLVEGSVTGSYVVLENNGTYYYYTKA